MSKLLTVSATSAEFKTLVETALADHRELFVLNRPSGTAGAKYWFLIRKWSELENIVNRVREKDAFSVFPGAFLELRGQAMSDLEGQALTLLEKYREIVLFVANPTDPELIYGWGTDEIEETKEFFEKYDGEQVLIGRWPDFELEIVGAYVPDADGIIRPGAY